MVYKTVLGPKQIVEVTAENRDNVTAEFEKFFNYYAAEGWVYHSSEIIPVKLEGKGLLAQQYINHHMLIFYKP